MFFKISPANQQPTSIKYPNSCQTVVNLLYFPHRKLSSTETAVNDIRTKSNILTRFKVESKKKKKECERGKMSKKYGAAWKSCQGKLNQRRHGPTSHNVENSTTAAAATSTRVSCHIVWGSENEDSGPSARPFVLLSSCLETLNTHYKTADRKAKPKPRYHMSAAPAWGIWELPTTR